MITKPLLSFYFLILLPLNGIAQALTIPPLPPCSCNGNSGFGGAIGLSSYNGNFYSNDFLNNTITLQFGLGGSFDDVFVIYIDAGTPGRSIIDNFVDDDTDGHTIAITNSNINGLGSIITFPNDFEATHAIAVDNVSGGLWSIPSSGTIGTGDLNYITSLNSSIISISESSYLDIPFDWDDLGLNPGDSFKYVGLYVSHLGATSDEGIGEGITEGTNGSDDVSFTSFRYIGSCDLILGTEENNSNVFSAYYYNGNLILEGLNERVSITVYDLLGRITHKSYHSVNGLGTIPLELTKNQLQFVEIMGISKKTVLKVLPN